jgi:hypothetical protein
MEVLLNFYSMVGSRIVTSDEAMACPSPGFSCGQRQGQLNPFMNASQDNRGERDVPSGVSIRHRRRCLR